VESDRRGLILSLVIDRLKEEEGKGILDAIDAKVGIK
jgi:hypothetical protein